MKTMGLGLVARTRATRNRCFADREANSLSRLPGCFPAERRLPTPIPRAIPEKEPGFTDAKNVQVATNRAVPIAINSSPEPIGSKPDEPAP